MNPVCINCGQPRHISRTGGYEPCGCLAPIFKAGDTLELYLRNGRKLVEDDFDDQFQRYLLAIWSFDRALEVAEIYRNGYRQIGLEPPPLDLCIIEMNTGHILSIIPLE